MVPNYYSSRKWQRDDSNVNTSPTDVETVFQKATTTMTIDSKALDPIQRFQYWHEPYRYLSTRIESYKDNSSTLEDLHDNAESLRAAVTSLKSARTVFENIFKVEGEDDEDEDGDREVELSEMVANAMQELRNMVNMSTEEMAKRVEDMLHEADKKFGSK